VRVEMYDERFTTRMAQRMEGALASEDSRAAAHMLEGWLQARQRDGP
jgi:RNase H-fold protein (predicted Holliday junction resolvase)